MVDLRSVQIILWEIKSSSLGPDLVCGLTCSSAHGAMGGCTNEAYEREMHADSVTEHWG